MPFVTKLELTIALVALVVGLFAWACFMFNRNPFDKSTLSKIGKALFLCAITLIVTDVALFVGVTINSIWGME